MKTLNNVQILQVTGAAETHQVKTTQLWKDANVAEYTESYTKGFAAVGILMGLAGRDFGAVIGLGVVGAVIGYPIGWVSGKSYVSKFETDGTYEMVKNS